MVEGKKVAVVVLIWKGFLSSVEIFADYSEARKRRDEILAEDGKGKTLQEFNEGDNHLELLEEVLIK